MNAPAPKQSAKEAGLRYVSDQSTGFTRRRYGRGFRYFDQQGQALIDKEHLLRIKALRIPPAWTKVWISPHPKGHLQATGRDARDRKQYLYHPAFSSIRNETKFEKMLMFVKSLPLVRKQVEEHLTLKGLPKEKVLATVVRLLETTSIRIGNEAYAKTNRSFGLTTLKNHHVQIDKSTIHFRFRGKSGIFHKIDLADRQLARIVKQCQELPGQDLFQYMDENHELCSIGSSDVNQYLYEVTGNEFTAKDFRTFSGTLCAFQKLKACFQSEEPAVSSRKIPSKKGYSEIVKQVAKQLGNTPSVCRRYYIHPLLEKHYMEKTFVSAIEQIQKSLAKKFVDVENISDEDWFLQMLASEA